MALSGTLLEIQNLKPRPDLLNQNWPLQVSPGDLDTHCSLRSTVLDDLIQSL